MRRPAILLPAPLRRRRREAEQEELAMQRLTKPGYRFLAELIMFPTAIGMLALVLSVIVD
jgi:hypothetical protein